MKFSDKQLKQALVKMLPEIIAGYEAHGSLVYFTGKIVLDTELLHLCWLVEETMNNDSNDEILNEYFTLYNYTIIIVGT